MADSYVLPSLVQLLTKLDDALTNNKVEHASTIIDALYAFDDVPGVLDHIHILKPALTHENVPAALHLVQEIMLPLYKNL